MACLDSGEERACAAGSFTEWEGGGTRIVARGLPRPVGYRTGIVTALVDDEVGRLGGEVITARGVDTSHLMWRAYHDIGRGVRHGRDFTERGFGVCRAVAVSDRGAVEATAHRGGVEARRTSSSSLSDLVAASVRVERAELLGNGGDVGLIARECADRWRQRASEPDRLAPVEVDGDDDLQRVGQRRPRDRGPAPHSSAHQNHGRTFATVRPHDAGRIDNGKETRA